MKYDLIIIGAGLVGGSLAAALSKEKLKVAVIDKAKAPVNSVLNFNSRAIALSWNSIQLLKQMGVWSLMIGEGNEESLAQWIKEVQVSEQGHFGVTRIKAQELGQAYLGAVLNADTLNWGINQFLLEKRGDLHLDFFRETEIESLKRVDGGWKLALQNGESIRGCLLVGADGTDSFLRKHQGVGLRIEPQLQTAMVMNVKLQQRQTGVAYERFLKHGSLAMLPFADNWVKCIWIVPNEQATYYKNKTAENLMEDLQKVFGFQLGYFQELGAVFTYPIQASSAENLYGLGWVLIGNAANTLSPVAAQGFNLGLRDACSLADEMIKLKTLGPAELGSLQRIDFLRQYIDGRMEGHRRIKQFTQQLGKRDLKRRLGILACELFDPLKQKIAHLGMGIHPL